MCGRYSITTPAEAMRTLFRVAGPLPNIEPRFNLAPTQRAPVVRAASDGTRECVMMRWGLVPFWAKDLKIGNQCINAKAETVAEKPAFRAAFKARRCLVPVSGFYEWQKQGKAKQPYWIGMKDKAPFAFAGLWERWGKDPEIVETFSIITGEPSELVAPIHNRMPVILPPERYDAWLGQTQPDALKAILAPFPADRMTAYPISAWVDSPKIDDSEIAQPLAQPGATPS